MDMNLSELGVSAAGLAKIRCRHSLQDRVYACKSVLVFLSRLVSILRFSREERTLEKASPLGMFQGLGREVYLTMIEG
jgi:hypothetical protein